MADKHVTCVMVTGKSPARQKFAAVACESFGHQTYPHRDLLVINDGPTAFLPTLSSELRQLLGERISEVHIPDDRLTLGTLRNIGLENARGDWIMQWDDDDWYHPHRIEYQMGTRKVGHACLLKWQIRYSFVTNTAWLYSCHEGIAGSVLHPATNGRYRKLRLAEDSEFIKDCFADRLRLVDNRHGTQPGPAIYVRMHTGNNSWPEKHIMKQFAGKKSRWDLPRDLASQLHLVLAQYYSN